MIISKSYRLDETELPNEKESWRDNLNQQDITNEDHNQAHKVWDTFNIKDMREYHDLYVRVDTLQFVDIFENFRKTCLDICKLDPAHFVSAPGLTWQACLKHTKIKLELLTDIDMPLMLEKGSRGGICQAIQHFAKANNKYMKKYNKNETSTFLEYLDANNLYGRAMSKELPYVNLNGYIQKNTQKT